MNQEKSVIIVEPKTPTMKRRRGRPSSNKKPASVLGESFFSLEKITTREKGVEPNENETAKVSQAALRKGFDSTPVMKLSPLKNVKKNKSVLLDLSNKKNHSNSTNVTMKIQTETSATKSSSGCRILETPDRKEKSFDSSQNSNFISSSPMTNIMSSEVNYRDSSSLQTSPLPLNTEDKMKNVQNMLQSSPWTGYEDQFNKYINSSPVLITRTPKKTERVNKSKRTSSTKVSRRIDLSRYRFNYQYRITLDINDYGLAQLYARVLEFNTKPLIDTTEGRSSFMTRRLASFETPMIEIHGDTGIKTELKNNEELDDCINFAFEQGIYQEGIVPSRFEQYIENCKRNNQEREAMIQNCMKNDVFFTAPTRYSQSLMNSPKHERTDKAFFNQAEHFTKTVNINHIIPENKGISAGVQHEYRNTLYTAEINTQVDDIELNMKPILCRPNDALSALREVVLNIN